MGWIDSDLKKAFGVLERRMYVAMDFPNGPKTSLELRFPQTQRTEQFT